MRTPPRSARPSLGLPAHESRAIGRRRRKASSRWMQGRYRSRQALTGKSGLGDASAEFVARGTSASSLARGESPRRAEREGDCGPRHDARVGAHECARTSLKSSCRSRWATTAGFIEAPSPVIRAGSFARATGSERKPSPRRRTLLTSEKSAAEAEPRAKQASRGSGRAWQLPPRLSSQARMGATAAHEGEAFASLAAWWASVPRWGASPVDAKWPLSMEGALDRESHHRSRGGGGSDLGNSRPGGPTRRRGHRPPKTGAGEATGASEVSTHQPRAEQHAARRYGSSERSGCGSPKRRTRTT